MKEMSEVGIYYTQAIIILRLLMVSGKLLSVNGVSPVAREFLPTQAYNYPL